VAIPDALKDGSCHTVYVYGIDPDDFTGRSNPQLFGAPKQFGSCSLLTAGGVTRHPRGSLVVAAGTVYFLGTDLRYPFPSTEIFLSWGNKVSDIVPANDADLQMPLGPIVEFQQ
jgi:hypothetical protein